MSEQRARSERGAILPNLRAWREHRAYNQAELARLAGIGRSTLVRGERGAVVGWPAIRKLAQALGTTPRKLQHEEPPTDEIPGAA